MSGVHVSWDQAARCFVGRDRHTQTLSAGTSRERAVTATIEAVAMLRRYRTMWSK
jgi:hypothetical protein